MKKTTTTKRSRSKGPMAQFIRPEPVTPEQRKGASKVKNPVGVTWVVCINATSANKAEPLARAAYTKLVLAAGVTYYTARTQVHRYMSWLAHGSPSDGLPRGVVIGK